VNHSRAHVIQIVFEVDCSDGFAIEIHSFRIRKRIRCPHNAATEAWEACTLQLNLSALANSVHCRLRDRELRPIPWPYPYRPQDLSAVLWVVECKRSIRAHAEQVRRSLEIAHFPVAKIIQVIEYKPGAKKY